MSASPSARPVRVSERFGLKTVLVLAAGLLLAGLAVLLFNERLYRQAREREVTSEASILAASVTAGLAFDDRQAVQEYVDAFGANPDIRGVEVVDSSGRVMARLARPPTRGAPSFTVRRAVAQGATRLGEVRLTASLEGLARRIMRFGMAALLFVMASLLLAALGAWQAALRRANGRLAEANRQLHDQMLERERAEEALRRSQKMEALGQLTGGIAHDFNNLLQVINGAFELIRRRASETAKIEGWATNGLQAAERGASLTRQLLAFSRAQKLELRPFVVSELVEGMRDLLGRTLGGNVDLEFELDDRRVPVLSDPTQLELAVLNLAINARDAMEEGGRLLIRTRVRQIPPGHPVLPPDDYVELSVTDTGSGMRPEVAARAFDPFFTTKGVGRGTGLGLSQVYGVARQAGGEASISSEPGKGTTVSLLLRRSSVEPTAEVPASETPAEAPARPTPATILVVDDDGDVRSMVRDCLETLGYRVITADGGVAALRVLDGVRPDLMLLDFAMPGMDGAETAGMARERWAELPIIFASGYADTAAVQASLGGSAVILAKPFDLKELALRVEAALKPRAAA